MKFKKLSLRQRIFFSMTLMVIMASVFIATITVYQYREQSNEYHKKRLERKEQAVKKELSYFFKNIEVPLSKQQVDSILRKHVFEIADIHNTIIHFYDLKGRLIASSTKKSVLLRHQSLLPTTLKKLASSKNHRILNIIKRNGTDIQALFIYVYNKNKNPIAILHIPYLNNNTNNENELEEFLTRLFGVYIFLFLISIGLAYIISSYITRSLKTVSDKMTKTRLYQRNEKIILKDASEEIYNLVNAYNGMIDELETNAVKLAKSEREHAWREMAKQVAHEIKNPLTPMRLTVQNFQRRFDKDDPEIDEKVNEFSKTIVQQIDVMNSIASAFSDFAKMPIPLKERLNIVDEVKLALDIFYENYIEYSYDEPKIYAELDRTQLTRIITNLVTNAIQALKEKDNPKIEVKVRSEGKKVIITVKDNGKGIKNEDMDKVFEPKFTTKTSGMGLGLPIIKNIIEAYKGTITFQSINDSGTIFTVTLPKVN